MKGMMDGWMEGGVVSIFDNYTNMRPTLFSHAQRHTHTHKEVGVHSHQLNLPSTVCLTSACFMGVQPFGVAPFRWRSRLLPTQRGRAGGRSLSFDRCFVVRLFPSSRGVGATTATVEVLEYVSGPSNVITPIDVVSRDVVFRLCKVASPVRSSTTCLSSRSTRERGAGRGVGGE